MCCRAQGWLASTGLSCEDGSVLVNGCIPFARLSVAVVAAQLSCRSDMMFHSSLSKNANRYPCPCGSQ